MSKHNFQRRTLEHRSINRPSAFSRNDRFERNPSETEDHPTYDSTVPTVQQSSVNAASWSSTSCFPTSALRDICSPLGVDCPNPAIIRRINDDMDYPNPAIIRSINDDMGCPNPAIIRSINENAEFALGISQRREPMGSEYPNISPSSRSSYASIIEKTKSYNNPLRKRIFRNVDSSKSASIASYSEGMHSSHFSAMKFGESSTTASTIGTTSFRKNYDLNKYPSDDDDYKDELSYEVEKILGKSVLSLSRRYPASCKSTKESSNNIISNESVAFNENRQSLQGQCVNRNALVGTSLSANELALKKCLSDTDVKTFSPNSKTPSHIWNMPDLYENMQLRTSLSHDIEDSTNSLTRKMFPKREVAFKNTLTRVSENRKLENFRTSVKPSGYIEDPQQDVESNEDVLYPQKADDVYNVIGSNKNGQGIINSDQLQNAPLTVSKDLISSGHPSVSLGPPSLYVNELFKNGEQIYILIKPNVTDSEESLQPSANTCSYLHLQPASTYNLQDIKDVATQTAVSYLTEQLPSSHEISTSSQAGNSHLEKIRDEMSLHDNGGHSSLSLHSPFDSSFNNDQQNSSVQESYMQGASSMDNEDTRVGHENLNNVGNDSSAPRKQFAKNESNQRDEKGRNLDIKNLTGVKSKIRSSSESAHNSYPHNLDNQIVVPEESSHISGQHGVNKFAFASNTDSYLQESHHEFGPVLLLKQVGSSSSDKRPPFALTSSSANDVPIYNKKVADISESSNQVELGEAVNSATCSKSPLCDLMNASADMVDEKQRMNYPMAKRLPRYIKVNGLTYCRIENSDNMPDDAIMEYYTDSYDASGKKYGSVDFVQEDTCASIPVNSSSKLETILEDCSIETDNQEEPMRIFLFSDVWKVIKEDVRKYQDYPMSGAIQRLRCLLDDHFEKCHKYIHIRVSDLQSMKENLLRKIREDRLGTEDYSEQASAIISMPKSGPLIHRGTSFSDSGTVHQSNSVQTSSGLGAASNAYKRTTATRFNRNDDYNLPRRSSIGKSYDTNLETGNQTATRVKERVDTSKDVGRKSEEQYGSYFSSHISHDDQNSQVPFSSSWCIPFDDRINKKVSLQAAFALSRAHLIENMAIRKRRLSVLEHTRHPAVGPTGIKCSEIDEAIRRPEENALHGIPNHTTTLCPTCDSASHPAKKVNSASCPKYGSSVTTKPVCSFKQTARKFDRDFGPVSPKTRRGACIRKLCQLTKSKKSRFREREPKNVYLEKKARDSIYAKYREKAKLFSQLLKERVLVGHVTSKLHETIGYMK